MKNIYLNISVMILFMTTSYSINTFKTSINTIELDAFSICDGYARAIGQIGGLTYEEEYDEFANCMAFYGY